MTEAAGKCIGIGIICLQQFSKTANEDESILDCVREKSALISILSGILSVVVKEIIEDCRHIVISRPYEGSTQEGEEATGENQCGYNLRDD